MKRCLIIGFLCLFYQGFTQTVPETFKKKVDSLVTAAPEGYSPLHSVLRSHRRDTVLMRYFANASDAAQYIDGHAYALNELGRNYRNLSQFSRSIELHKRALDLAAENDNLEFRVSSLNNLGVVYRRTSSIRTAMDYNQQALELAESVENPSRSIKRSINVSVNCIGNLYQMLNQHDRAIAYFEKSLQLETELNNLLGQAVNSQNIGECKEELGDLTGALKDYRTSLALNEKIDNDMGRVICNNAIAKIYIKQDNPQEAIELLQHALPKAQKLGDGFLIAPVFINLGWSKLLLKKYTEAEKNMLQGLKIAEEKSLISEASQANRLLSELNKEQRNFEKALTYNLKAEELQEQILNTSTVRYVNDIMFRYDSQKRSNEIEVLAKEKEIVELNLRKKNTTLLISAIVLALLAGIFYILYRQYQLKNEKKLLTLEQSMLRSQMNPHFLFNSLNSIKLYIINNEQKNAVHYLNKFSKLVRKILEASSLREIPLAEELETVELYMNIENIRFSNEIDFEIKISDEIDPHTVKIPSLILQPFLENALWHGLSSKTGEKKIVLNVRKASDENFIHISITDNGIGRMASEEIKQSKVLKRKSVGIDITKERLSNFSRDYLNSFNLQILDLYTEDGKPEGTKVLLHIPIV
ncbi:tetratricopeptide repeat protein [Maribacter algarum]|uniref:Tetratricopeptide repeat protein n=1 Tax=Maribacter algarum (ex Zhang et al. 2020) TaxID=2578118 RepID=A0A5S3PUS5_9FLAO|nr:tetratricopeptide repeat protein [Maribacter algarum]TMM58761.1 tetratricopeptide repeat protein [Maribacter algarum]